MALDTVESQSIIAGLLQSMTYVLGTSGGAWLVGSVAGWDNQPVSDIANWQWKGALADNILSNHRRADPQLQGKRMEIFKQVLEDVGKKHHVVWTQRPDYWSRLLGYQLLPGERGGRGITMSGLLGLPSFQRAMAPIPILTALGANFGMQGEIFPNSTSPIIEFTPFETGVWNRQVAAFIPTEYLGSMRQALTLVDDYICMRGLDNLAYIIGTTSSQLNHDADPQWRDQPHLGLPAALDSMIPRQARKDAEANFALWPNPFYRYDSLTATALDKMSDWYSAGELRLVDGSESSHGIVLEPLLEPARNVSVIFVSDTSAGMDSDGFPDGGELAAVHRRVLKTERPELIARMPNVISTRQLRSTNNSRAKFFGCGEPDAVTIIYLPFASWAINITSAPPDEKLVWAPQEVDAMLENGRQVATQGDDDLFQYCIACAMMEKQSGQLPDNCDACFDKYCYKPVGLFD